MEKKEEEEEEEEDFFLTFQMDTLLHFYIHLT